MKRKSFFPWIILLLVFPLAGCANLLMTAAERGDVNAMSQSLKDGVNINQAGRCSGFPLIVSPLNCAIFHNQMEAVKFLLDRGADFKKSYPWPAIMMASYEGKVDILKLLLERGASPNTETSRSRGTQNTALGGAALYQRGEAARLLISRGADVDNAIRHLKTRYADAHLFADPQEWKRKLDDAIALLNRLNPEGDRAPAPPAPAVAKARVEAPPAPMKSHIKSALRSDVEELPAPVAMPRGNDYAVVIGIETYRSLSKSDYSRKDAALVKAYFKSLGFPERNIDFLTDERATKTDIEKSLEAWLPNRVKRDSTVLIYYSGHGSPDPASGEPYLVPYDGDPNYIKVTGYALKRLYQSLGKLRAREVIVILDSCFSGAGGRSVLARGARPLVIKSDHAVLSANMVVLAATQESQISTSSPERGHGIFTYHFLKAIQDGKRNIAEIYEYIRPQVEDEAKLLNVQQTPSLKPELEKLTGKFNLRR